MFLRHSFGRKTLSKKMIFQNPIMFTQHYFIREFLFIVFEEPWRHTEAVKEKEMWRMRDKGPAGRCAAISLQSPTIMQGECTMQQLSRCTTLIITVLVSFADTSRNKTELDKHEGWMAESCCFLSVTFITKEGLDTCWAVKGKIKTFQKVRTFYWILFF